MLELSHQKSYPKHMLKRFTHYFACLLLVLIPLQGFAAANMSICNSMMQAATETKVSATPCHKHTNMQMAEMTKAADNSPHKNTGKSTCKAACATLCASLSSITALNQTTPAMPVLATTQVLVAYSEIYTSYLPPNLQRPPILLS